MTKILLAEDDEIMQIILRKRLEADGWTVNLARDGKDIYVKIKQEPFHLVIFDISMLGLDGINLLKKIKQTLPQTDVIIMTAFGAVNEAVFCLKNGAADYILKPFGTDDLSVRVRRLLEIQTAKAKCAALEAAPTDPSILITGSSETDKEPAQITPIEFHSLKNRKEDIPELCDKLLIDFSQIHGLPLKLSPEALDVLMAYDYPGNVRELRNIIERVSMLATSPLIMAEQLPVDLRVEMKHTDPEAYNLAKNLSVSERDIIHKALSRAEGCKAEAAKLLGISRKNLWEKLKKFG